jgi:hypothetical protein
MVINESQIIEKGKHSDAKYFLSLYEEKAIDINAVGCCRQQHELLISSAVLSLFGDLNESRY